ncbi:PaaI family thioesterase [Desulfonema ishimotonii]|uniref:PaaI family thioesterase n=1 Tax=Desulfonema ishimotonii TaxID=45657 RepID=A0A401G0V4_9BACT|nr:PaaI family thioesterase [Desulfonema ishimotonii]GBC62813.1 PaaI family thioesterase [Desulfonema ishimotonii]
MSNSEHYRKLENMMHSAPIVQLFGARAEIREGEAEITLTAREELFHAASALHGAAYFLALDNSAFFAVNSLVEDVFVLTSSFNTYLIRPVTGGEVRAVGRVVSATRTQFIAESVMYDDKGREVARGSGVFVKGRTALTAKIGYK